MHELNEWIEDAISKKHIKYYEYSYFKNIQEIDRGGFGVVYRVNWKNQTLALKSLNNYDSAAIKELIHEIKLHREIDFHSNIIRFYGITSKENQNKPLRNYLLVMEYANGGCLQDYLIENFEKLTWNDKYRLARQLAWAVLFLHDEEIVHCDLHSKNILVHQNTIKLADFGLSMWIGESSNFQSKIYGVIPYIDPKRLDKGIGVGEKLKFSDVYSVGVIFWELSSGYRPFKDRMYDSFLAMEIAQGLRETPVPDTPNNYTTLYEECWNDEINKRPAMEEVVTKLDAIIAIDGEKDKRPAMEQVVTKLDAIIGGEQQLKPDNDVTSNSGEVPELVAKLDAIINDSKVIKNSQLINERPNSVVTSTNDSSHGELSQLKQNISIEGKINLLIVGNTGSGKSALANVLSDTNDFKEKEYSISKDKNLQKKDFELKEKKYCVVEADNIADNIAEVIQLMPEGISQVLFVIDGILTEKMGTFISENGIAEYTTIVRTKFNPFKNKGECEKDKKQLLEGNESIVKIVKSCGIVYVNNPPINIIGDDYDDREKFRIHKKIRTKSRTILLDHLKSKVYREKYYKSKPLWDMSSPQMNVRRGVNEKINLLIVGNTGSGKSTLANILSDTNDFKENEYSISKTKKLQKMIFELNEKEYYMIETDNNNITETDNIETIIDFMPKGISQVLFVVDGTLTEEMGTFISENDIIDYTTIVRTKFVHFNNKRECEKDEKQLLEGNESIAKVVKSCGIVYVNNPPINIIGDDDDDKETIRINKKIRAKSRTILLDHLKSKVYREKYYKLKTWDEINVVPNFKPNLPNFDVINLLIVGHTSSGKSTSTLANVLSDTNHFDENEYSIDETKNLQKKVFELNGKKYCVIKTNNLAEVIYFMPEGISQVLFVVDGILTEEIGRFIFENGIAEYTTIVRTKFVHFKNKSECEKDKKKLLEGNESIAKIVKSCGIVHVNNSSINIIDDDHDDKEKIRINEINKKMKAKSRNILLDHLEKKVCREKYYKLKMWDKIKGEEIRNLLIVGNTGSGKSALANVLSDTNEFEESVSKLRNYKKKAFESNKKKYCAIEADNMTEVTYFMPEWISQVLFVIDGVLTEEIGTFIFESGIAEYTTIVRTKFIHFKNKGECEKDIKKLLEGNESIAKIVKSCGIVHVNNPPINIIGDDYDDKETIRINKKIREKSRAILLDHLEKKVCREKYTVEESDLGLVI